jgi:hypothetical protein
MPKKLRHVKNLYFSLTKQDHNKDMISLNDIYSSLEGCNFEIKKMVAQKDGTFVKESCFMHFLRTIFFRHQARLLKVERSLEKLCTRIEHLGVGQQELTKEKTNILAQKLLTQCRSESLKQHALALHMRCSTQEERMHALAETWKEENSLYGKQNRDLTEPEKQALAPLEKYPEFLHWIQMHPSTKDNFFKWTLREGNPAEIFIKYPALATSFQVHLVSQRVGRFALLQLEENGDVTLPFVTDDGVKRFSILDPYQEITLNGGYAITMGKILQVIKDKFYQTDLPHIEFFQEGIRNWNSYHIGKYNQATQEVEKIDLTKEKWWEQMPPTESISKKELKARLNLNKLDDGQWIGVKRAARSSTKMRLLGTHGFLSIYIPDPKNANQYNLYSFGKFIATFPRGIAEQALLVTATKEAAFTNHDENDFFSHRQQAHLPFVFNETEGLAMMQEVKKLIHEGREKRLHLQFVAENCAHSVEDCFPVKLKGHYERNIWDIEPKEALFKRDIAWIKNGKNDTERTARAKKIVFRLGGWRKHKGVSACEKFESTIHHPATLFEKTGVVAYMGHLNFRAGIAHNL